MPRSPDFPTFCVVGPENSSKPPKRFFQQPFSSPISITRKFPTGIVHCGLYACYRPIAISRQKCENPSRKMAIVSRTGVKFHPESIGNIGLGGTSRISDLRSNFGLSKWKTRCFQPHRCVEPPNFAQISDFGSKWSVLAVSPDERAVPLTFAANAQLHGACFSHIWKIHNYKARDRRSATFKPRSFSPEIA